MSSVVITLTKDEARLIYAHLKKRSYTASGRTPTDEALNTLEKALKEEEEPKDEPNGTAKK